MRGTLYGVGVGPGDPELMTVKVLRMIKQADIIVLPAEDREHCRAYNIAKAVVPSLDEKKILALDFKMTTDPDIKAAMHAEHYRRIREYLAAGQDVAFLTIGDPALYSTYTNMAEMAASEGISCEMISGVSSVAACAAASGISLGLAGERIHIIPDLSNLEKELRLPGTKVIMKCGRAANKLRGILKRHKQRCLAEGKHLLVYAVSDCGGAHERCYEGIDALPDDCGYMMTVIVKEQS